MNPSIDRIKDNRVLIFSLLGIGFVILISNVLGKDIAKTTSDFIFVPVSGVLLVLAVILAIRFKGKKNFGISYIFFACFSAAWFAAELIWMNYEIFNKSNPFPYVDDAVYLSGYIFLWLFSRFYLKPVGAAISKKMLGYAFLAVTVFLVPTLYTVYLSSPSSPLVNILWAGIYPIADAALLFPTVIAMMLFFKGNVSFLWSLMFFAILLNIVADSGFLYLDVDKSYSSGNPIDILYLWSYVLFSFGIYSQIKVFRKQKMKSYKNLDEFK